MQRFFVPPHILKAKPVVLSDPQAHQIRHVLRLRPGDHVVLLDNDGLAYEAELKGYDANGAQFELLGARPARGEPAVHVTLYQAVLKGERFEWVLQKGTELGISCFVPLVCDRSIVVDHQSIARKRERWELIIREAAEQSGRARLPRLAPSAAFADAIRSPRDAHPKLAGGQCTGLIAWEAEQVAGLREVLAACNLTVGSRIQVFIGPEGGLTEDEVARARDNGLCPVSLGPRILRAETAGVAVAAAIFYESGEMAPLRAHENGEIR